MEDVTVRCVMYKDKSLVDYFDFGIDNIEHNLIEFEGAVDDELADLVQIILYQENRRITSWKTPVDRLFKEFIENVIDELMSERFVREVELSYDD